MKRVARALLVQLDEEMTSERHCDTSAVLAVDRVTRAANASAVVSVAADILMQTVPIRQEAMARMAQTARRAVLERAELVRAGEQGSQA
jgi:hypothetical protein